MPSFFLTALTAILASTTAVSAFAQPGATFDGEIFPLTQRSPMRIAYDPSRTPEQNKNHIHQMLEKWNNGRPRGAGKRDLGDEDKEAIFQALPGMLFSTILRNGNPNNIKDAIANSRPIRPWQKAIKRSPSPLPMRIAYDPSRTPEQNNKHIHQMLEKWNNGRPRGAGKRDLDDEDKEAIFQALPGLLFSTILRNGNPSNIKDAIANSRPIRPWQKAIKRSPSPLPMRIAYDPKLTKEENQERVRVMLEKWNNGRGKVSK